MTHDEARLRIGAAPSEVSSSLAEHLAQCPQCTLFQQQMHQMDHDLTLLFTAPLPHSADTRVLSLPVNPRSRLTPVARGFFPGMMTLAASLVLCVGLTLLFWTLRPQRSLAGEVLGHVALESGSWSTVAPIDYRRDGCRTRRRWRIFGSLGAVTVTYARTCLFNGHWVPHLVVHTTSGAITVMVLRQEHLAAREAFRQNGYSGILVPTPAGARSP